MHCLASLAFLEDGWSRAASQTLWDGNWPGASSRFLRHSSFRRAGRKTCGRQETTPPPFLHRVLLQAPNNDKLLSDFYRECRILSTVRHANVVRFIGAYWDEEAKEPLLVMEAAKENLKQYLERNKAQLGVERQLVICSGMTKGLSYLHGRAEPITHRDLKPENVLVWEDGAVKIGDFGQSKLLDHPGEHMKTRQPGTMAYMPPETLKKKPRYTSKVDVFSLGAVMLEVCTQSPPSVWPEGIGRDPEVGRRKDDLALLSDTHPVKPLIIWCLQDNHESRPDVGSTHDQMKLLVCCRAVGQECMHACDSTALLT